MCNEREPNETAASTANDPPLGVDRVVSTAVRIAKRTIHSWDNHERFRMTEEDRLFFEGEPEPCGVTMARAVVAMESAIRQTIKENLHLADGDDCTLRRLVRLFPEC